MKDVIESMWRFRRVLYSSTRTELQKRYAGSLLGPVWPVLYPLLFLSGVRAQVVGHGRASRARHGGSGVRSS